MYPPDVHAVINPPDQAVASCNDAFLNIYQPWLTMFKRGVPSAYVFPFDDPYSTFQCGTGPGANTNSYVVKLCPVKPSWLPSYLRG